MRYAMMILSMIVLPTAAFAGDTVVKTEHYKMSKGGSSRDVVVKHQQPVQRQAAANYEDSRYQKWASMTAEERDLAKQRGETSYRDWQHYEATRNAQKNHNARVERHHPDKWQGKTAEEKDALIQRNSAFERSGARKTGQHHPDKWHGKTAEQKDVIKQRHSTGARTIKRVNNN